MSDNLYASPECSVDIYPWEGVQPYSLTGGNVLQCVVTKDLQDAGGSATIILAPGGPNGQGFPSWAQVITLQSLVVIALARGSYSNVVFVGVVQRVEETQNWMTNSGVNRATRITAMDWGVWFQDSNWSALTAIGCITQNIQAEAVGIPAEDGIPAAQFGKLFSNPGQAASVWLNQIMAGESGLLANTTVRYGSQSISWTNATTSFFEVYPFQTIFPLLTSFISTDGTWYSKFQEILEYPYYDLIIGTAPDNVWNEARPTQPTNSQTNGLVQLQDQNSAYVNLGQAFSSIGLKNAIPAYAKIVGRVNPLPDLTVSLVQIPSQTIAGQVANPFDGVTSYRYRNLPKFQLDENAQFYSSTSSLSMPEYYNFFVLNPTAWQNIVTQSPTNVPGVFLYAYSGCANIASIQRYGFKSLVKETGWMTDPAAIAAQAALQAEANSSITFYSNTEDYSSPGTMPELVQALVTRLATLFTPLPIMDEAQVTFHLRPDIFVGCQFEYYPYRGDSKWNYYIRSVSHSFIFGGDSTTSLGLERGLRATVYNDRNLLQAVLTGNAQRTGGNFTSTASTSAPGLQCFGVAPKNLQTVLGEIAQVYSTAGAA